MPEPRTVILAYGDVIDDVVAIPVGPIRDDTDTVASIRFAAGGSAANTAAWLGTLGADVEFVGIVGGQDVDRHRSLLAKTGVVAHLQGHATLPTGTIIVISEGERRAMLTERGANAALNPATVTAEMLAAAGVLHIAGHALLNDAGGLGIAALIGRALAAGAAVSVAPGSAGFIADYGPAQFLQWFSGATILFPSLDEGRLLTGFTEPQDVAAELGRQFEVVALTMGAEGVLVMHDGIGRRVAAVLVPMLDPTGAGDAFCAGFLDEWVRSHDPAAAAHAGALVASRAVGVIGGRPTV